MIAKYEFLDESIKNPELTVALEGYLYPETYFFYRETNARDVTMRFLDEFDRNYQMFKGQLEGSEMSFHDLITLASVVQFESGHPDDMKLIAGIFENRLRDGYRLQSSVTVCYALYEYDSWLDCEQNYEVESPYNTYMIDGLPIGPVCNPGIDAIEAVLNPTPSDYMYFIADVYGVPKEEREQRIKEYADLFGLTEDLAQPISAYSHGMKQKLAIISALIHSPKLLIMDEPFVGLDPKAAHELKQIMRRLCDNGSAIFFSTHVLEVAEKLCDKVAIIKGGRLVVSGTMEEVKGQDSLEDVFLELEDDNA